MEGPERRRDSTPFKEKLIENTVSVYHIGKEKLYELEHDPSKVVRVETFEQLRNRYHSTQDIVELVSVGQSLFRELSQDYGIPVQVSFIIGKDPSDRDAVYAVTDKIVGKNLDTLEPSPAHTAKVEALFERLAEYHADKWRSGEPFLVDIDRTSQFVYGRPFDNQDVSAPEQIYLVDTDLRFFQGAGFIYSALPFLAQQLAQVEKQHKTRFSRARATVETLLGRTIPKGFTENGIHTIEQRIAETRDILDD